ncbi:unnamed protein product [Schistosoma margrebowiei]|uniref:Uncharacterized protein n=1 Tax=Schistosoma margrebowiei TaxID=48269 RepID=A0A183L901_9TREM|nr:unnamed protein product [Schistosoma margrebowiei]
MDTPYPPSLDFRKQHSRREKAVNEPLMESTNSDYMTDIPSGELWFKRVHEHRFNKKDRLPISVKRPQKSANYYYDLYRQSMLPTNEFLG